MVESTETVARVREVIGQDDKGRDVVLYAGEPCRVTSNGALQRVSDGRMVRPPTVSPLQPVRTSEQASALAWQRWHGKRQDAVRQAVERASGSAMPDVDTADAYIIADMVEGVVLNIKVRADHRTKAAQWVYEQSGMDGRAPKQSAADPAQGLRLTLEADADTIERLVMALAAAKNG